MKLYINFKNKVWKQNKTFYMFFTDTFTCPILEPMVPLFWISGDVSSRFQSLICFCEGTGKVHSMRSTSGATPADHLTTSIAASHFPTCISRGGSWLGFKQAITCTENKCATIVPGNQLKKKNKQNFANVYIK